MQTLVRLAVGNAIFFFIFGVAFWRGGRPERMVALTSLLALILSPLVSQVHGGPTPQLGVFLVDLVVLAVTLRAALRSDRWWPLFAAAFAFMLIARHMAQTFGVRFSQNAYVSAGVIYSYCHVLALGFGLVEIHVRDRRSPRPVRFVQSP